MSGSVETRSACSGSGEHQIRVFTVCVGRQSRCYLVQMLGSNVSDQSSGVGILSACSHLNVKNFPEFLDQVVGILSDRSGIAVEACLHASGAGVGIPTQCSESWRGLL